MNTLQKTIESIAPLDKQSMNDVQKRLDSLTKPKDSLGKLERVIKQIAGIRRDPLPDIRKKAAILMAGDHGVAAQNVSAYPQEVTVQMLMNFARGGAAMSILLEQLGGQLYIVNVGVAHPVPPHARIIDRNIKKGSDDISKGPAMTEKEATAALQVGIDMANMAIQEGADIIAIGEMGIANTTPSAAIASFYTGLTPEDVTGRGSGIDDVRFQNKIRAVRQALALNKVSKSEPLLVLAQLGGLEIAGLAGVILGSAAGKTPVVIDGFISSVAAISACELAPLAKHYIIGSHLSFEPGHQAVLNYLQIEPMLLLDMRLGEGSGAALAMQIIDSSMLLLHKMATFEEAGVAVKI
ncbi:MAG: nicotinate-nucleotide--dimethylbenzimidazole phosphoribosyltransferase [Bacillota bacterium]|jgi:nicotinate-nucleotide--dimethylbenzimidazole phosphoribosyltransferase